MKAAIFLSYRDGSEVCFTYECVESMNKALGTLMMVCRGTLMASSAKKVVAYDEGGINICAYKKQD